ncbi:MAG: dTMP kinase [Candidatus Cloacimonadota bacterium]|nr:dTMP kinase [Candidatus Cloacimonadota bacterium]
MKKKNSITNGLFITFEGIEGCGKSTQAKLLAKNLTKAGYEILLTREPGGPQISEKIRDILLDNQNEEMYKLTEIFLYMASRSQHTFQWIKPALEEGKIIICDRYYDSTFAYQGAARNIPADIVKSINKIAILGTNPDTTFLVDVPVNVGLARINKLTENGGNIDRLESESVEFHQRVRDSYLKLSEEYSERIAVLNGLEKVDSLQSKIQKMLKNKYKIKF